MAELTPPIGTQVSRLAAADPDAPAVTCAGRTLTRAELDLSTNRLARAFAERGVELGDDVTIALPNSIEFLQAAIAAWKLGAVPQPLPARLPDNEFDGLMALRPRALVVGRADPSGKVPSVPAGFIPDPAISDAALPEAVTQPYHRVGAGHGGDEHAAGPEQAPRLDQRRLRSFLEMLQHPLRHASVVVPVRAIDSSDVTGKDR